MYFMNDDIPEVLPISGDIYKRVVDKVGKEVKICLEKGTRGFDVVEVDVVSK